MAQSSQETFADGPASTVPEAESGVAAGRGKWSPARIAIALVCAVVLVWLAIKAAEDLRAFAVVTLNGVTLAALYFVVASGFTLAFGLMRVVNMAHGSLYLLGGYFAFEIQDQGDVFTGGEPKHSWWFSALTASLLIGIIGLLIQQLLLRWNQGEMLQQALITIAVS